MRFHGLAMSVLLILVPIHCVRPTSALACNESLCTTSEMVHPDRYILAWRLRQLHDTDSVDFQPWRIVGGLLCGALATALASAGGIGGGGLYVPIFNLVLGFNSKTSAALSSCTIVGATLVTILWYAFQKDATSLGPLVDYQVALLCLPNVLLGISAGVMCNVASPSWLVTALLILVLFSMAFRSCRNAIQRWNIESSCSLQSEHSVKHGPPSDIDESAHDNALISPPFSHITSAPGEFRNMCKDEELEMPLLESHSNRQSPFPVAKMAMLCLVWIAFLAVQLVRGSSDGQNFFGIETCGTMYWIVTLAQLPLAIVVTAFALLHFWRNIKKERGIPTSEEGASLMESGSMTVLPIYALGAGFLGGMLGLGGGTIISPLLLEMGMHPQITAATCSYMVFFSSSLSMIQFWLLGRIPQVYALASASVALVFSVTGLLVIHTVISKYGRVSLIVFAVSIVMGISAVLMAVFGTWDVIYQIEQNAYMGFRSPC